MRQKGRSADPCGPISDPERQTILQSYEIFTEQKVASMIYPFLLLPFYDRGMHTVWVPTLDRGNQVEKWSCNPWKQGSCSILGIFFAAIRRFTVKTKTHSVKNTTCGNISFWLSPYAWAKSKFKSTYNKSLTKSGFYWIISKIFYWISNWIK